MKALPVISFIAGGAAGALTMWLLREDVPAPSSPVAAASLATENKTLTDKVKSLEMQLAGGKSTNPGSGAKQPDADGNSPVQVVSQHFDEGKIQELMKQQGERDVNREVDKMALRLKLTPEQKESLRKFLLAQKEHERDRLHAALNDRGAIGREKKGPDKEEFLKSLLSPEQQAEYARSREEQRAAKAEEYAQRRVRRLNEQLSLTEEQKDRLFQAYAQQKLAATDPNAPKPADAPAGDTIAASAGAIVVADATGSAGPVEFEFDSPEIFGLGGSTDLDRSVLEGILTPDQMGVYDRRKAEDKSQLQISGLPVPLEIGGSDAASIHIEVQKPDSAPAAPASEKP